MSKVFLASLCFFSFAAMAAPPCVDDDMGHRGQAAHCHNQGSLVDNCYEHAYERGHMQRSKHRSAQHFYANMSAPKLEALYKIKDKLYVEEQILKSYIAAGNAQQTQLQAQKVVALKAQLRQMHRDNYLHYRHSNTIKADEAQGQNSK